MAFDPTKARAYIQPEEYAALADVIFVVEGSKLPAHSQVLAQHSSVLRGLFLEQEPSRQQPVQLKDPFKDYSADVVASCLWFMYHPMTLPGADLGTLGDKLPALLRLGNQLDFTALQNAVLQHLQASIIPGASLDAALEWASVLEQLHLSKPWAACMLRLAHLVTAHHSMADAVGFRAYQLKDRLSLPAMAALMGAASARASTGALPAADALVCWLEGREPPIPHTFVWRITGYSGLSGMARSETFVALGQSWKLRLSPRGDDRRPVLYVRAEGLYGQQEVRARVKCHLVNARDQSANVTKEASHSFTRHAYKKAFDFLPKRTIKDPEAGFLVDDCITLAVDIQKPQRAVFLDDEVSDFEDEIL